MWTDGIKREDVVGRARVQKLIGSFPEEALKVARAISHPWYRCQALSTVAEHEENRNKKLKLLREALDAAKAQSEVNRVVTVASWPLRVMAPIAAHEVEEHLRHLVAYADTELHTLRRADALCSLAYAVKSNAALLGLVLPSLKSALLAGHGWRIDRIIRATVDLAQSMAPENVQSLVAHHTEGRIKRKWIASMAGGIKTLEAVAYVPFSELLAIHGLEESKLQDWRARLVNAIRQRRQIPDNDNDGEAAPVVSRGPPPPISGGSSAEAEDNDTE